MNNRRRKVRFHSSGGRAPQSRPEATPPPLTWTDDTDSSFGGLFDGVPPRQRTWLALGAVAALWGMTALVVVRLIHAGVLSPTKFVILPVAAFFCALLIDPIWFGVASSPSVRTRGGRPFLVGRSLTGRRSLDLRGLVQVGRFTMVTRGETIDLLLLRDRHGVRLSIREDRLDGVIRQVVRSAREDPADGPIRVSHYAERRLNRRAGEHARRAGYSALGLLRYMAAPIVCMLVALFLTRLLGAD